MEQQDETINTIEQQAFNVQKDTEAGWVVCRTSTVPDLTIAMRCRLQYTEKAVDSARAARKKRWICFIIIVVVIIAVVGGVAGKIAAVCLYLSKTMPCRLNLYSG